MAPATILAPGAQLHASLGYRVHPTVSAGFLFQQQWLGTVPYLTTADSASAWAIGAYVRFCPAPLFLGSLSAPRVRFDDALDLRRFDPWLGAGVEFAQQLTWTSVGHNPVGTLTDVRRSIGVPMAIGIAYRILVPLAVEITAGIDPWFGSGVDKSFTQNDTSGNATTTTTQVNSPTPMNVQWSVGIGVRYTLMS